MPSDIDPQSGFACRCRSVRIWTTSASAPTTAPRRRQSIVGLRGPAGIRLYSPKTAEARAQFSNYLRFDVFPANIREVAILTVAREMDSQFEWAAHEPEALKEGVPADVVDVIKHRKSTQGWTRLTPRSSSSAGKLSATTKSPRKALRASRNCSRRQSSSNSSC